MTQQMSVTTTQSEDGESPSGRTPLSRDRILAAALAYTDQHGLQALSMRKLAAELGVEAMSLYNHIDNKDDILVGIADLVFAEVVIPTPYWVSFPEQVKLAGGVPVYVDTDEADGFALRAETIFDACTDRTRVVVLNTPSNPSGAVIGRSEMLDLAKLAIERDIYLLVDECYAALVYDGAEHVTPLAAGVDAKDVTILCGSCSKSYAMTGWRIGYIAAPAPLIKACTSLQGHSTSNAASVSQYAALEALTGDQTPARQMLTTFAERRDAVLPRIREIPGVTCVEPQGAFYAFPNVSALLNDDLPTSAELAGWLIDECHVVTVPGTAFGRAGHLRLSYATSMSVLEEALDRIAAACESLTA